MRQVPATGFRQRNKTCTLVYFDPDQFEAIRKMALADKTSFSEAVRTLVEWGMESAEMET